MFSFDYITKEDIKEHNPNWPENPDHSYQILITGGSGSLKTNALLFFFFYNNMMLQKLKFETKNT